MKLYLDADVIPSVEDCTGLSLDSSDTVTFNLDFASKHSFTTLYRINILHHSWHLRIKNNTCSRYFTFQIWLKINIIQSSRAKSLLTLSRNKSRN